MRDAMFLMTAVLLASCGGSVEAVWDPKTGQTDTCSTVLDWSPWSQRDACLAEHVAQGWMVKMRE